MHLTWMQLWVWLSVAGALTIIGISATVSQSALSCCLGFENCGKCPLVRYLPMSWRAKTITAVNACPQPVAVAIKYSDARAIPRTVGWQEIPAQSAAKIHPGNGEPIVSYGATFRYEVVPLNGAPRLPDPAAVPMKTENIFDTLDIWWSATTRMRVVCGE